MDELAVLREAIGRWYAAALHAVDPERAVAARLRRDGRGIWIGESFVPVAGRLVVVSVGKAALPMARAAHGALGDRIDAGIVLTKEGHLDAPAPPGFDAFEAGHPIPDGRGVAATGRILDLVSGLGPGDVVLALISGGGSALLEAPRDPVTLADLAATTDLLLRAGAPIQDLNAVRTPLSRTKGGGLRAAAPDARFVTLILSDVLSNDPRVIASGPTIPAAPDAVRALELLDRHGVRPRVPASVLAALEARASEEAHAPEAPEDVVAFVGDNRAAVAAVFHAAEAEGLSGEIRWDAVEGEASALGRVMLDVAELADPGVDLLLGGGEATVAVRGAGVGGRNTELALAAALAMAERGDDGWVIASLATDGQDGPTGVAGAMADSGTVGRATAAGVDPARALRDNDSLRVFEAAGGIVAPGPTGTNVNDIYLAVRTGAARKLAR